MCGVPICRRRSCSEFRLLKAFPPLRAHYSELLLPSTFTPCLFPALLALLHSTRASIMSTMKKPLRASVFLQLLLVVLCTSAQDVHNRIFSLPTPSKESVEQDGEDHRVIDHGDALFTRYAHLAPQSITISAGELVQPGDPIALMGNSGRSDVRHLFQSSEQRILRLSPVLRPSPWTLFSIRALLFEHMMSSAQPHSCSTR